MSNLGVVKLELSKIIHLHNDFPATVNEVACDISGKVVFEQIEKEAADLDVKVSVAAKIIVSTQVKGISEFYKNGGSIERALDGLLSTVKLLLRRGTLAPTDISNLLLSDELFLSLPLTALWKFKCLGVVSFEEILQSIHDEKGGSFPSLLEDLMKLILRTNDDLDGTSIVSEALGALLNLSYNLTETEYHAISKIACDSLDSVTEHILDILLGSCNNSTAECLENRNAPILNIYELLMNNIKITSQALQSYCSSQLIYILTFRPNLHVASVLKSQEKWRSTRANPVLSLLMQKLVIILGYEAALHSLNTVVTNDEVNWGCVLTLVATTINSHKYAVSLLKTIIEKHIRKGCEEQDVEFLVIGFIFARHASQEGCHLFPSYSQWFSGLFATELGSPAAHKQSFVFLIQFLTDLVPHEPAYCLRAHLTNHIFVPKGCQSLLQDYQNLARARLQELKDNLDSCAAPEQNLQKREHIIELSNIMNQLLNAADVLPILSQISHKIEKIMRAADLEKKTIKPLILNPRMCDLKLLSYQVIQEFVNTLEKVCLGQKQKQIIFTRPNWIPQFVSLLSSSNTLQLSLFNYLLYNLEYGQHHNMSLEKIQIQAVLISEIFNLEGLFSYVVNSSSIKESPGPFVMLFLYNLGKNLSKKQACIHSCRLIYYWLHWHMKSDTEGGTFSLLPEKVMNLYCFLAPRINLIVSEEDDEVSIATVYSSLDGQGVPMYTGLYFDQIRKSAKQNETLALEKWITFELLTTWEKTPLDIRLSYLQCRVQRDYIFRNTHDTSQKGIAVGEVMIRIIHTFVETGLTENSSEIIMLLQRLCHLYPGADICILKEWHFNMRKKPIDYKKLSLFISLCHCLPPSFFLPSKQLLQLSSILEQFVILLMEVDQGIVLNLCDTTYLVSCLFHAAKDPCVKDIHLKESLKPVRTSVIFHWESLKSVFEDNIHIVKNYNCLESLKHVLDNPINNFSCLPPEESCLVILSLCLENSSVYTVISGKISSVRNRFLKWLLAYIGFQQKQGLVPFFPEKDLVQSVKDKDENIVFICKRELQVYLLTCNPLKLVEEIFCSDGEFSLALSNMTTAFIFIVLLEFTSCGMEALKKTNKDSLEVKLLEILLQGYICLGKRYDCRKVHGGKPHDLVKKTKDLNDIKYSNDLRYISHLYQKIFSLLCQIPQEMLGSLSKSTIADCEGELHSLLIGKLPMFKD